MLREQIAAYLGANGYNPEGVRIGQDENRQGKALKVWDKREFKDYDDHLLFAGTNEIGIDWRRAPPENCPIHRSYNQTFIDAVRATGGNNAHRRRKRFHCHRA